MGIVVYSTDVRSWVSHLLLRFTLTLTGAVQMCHSLYYSFIAHGVTVSIQIGFDRKWQKLVWDVAFSVHHFSVVVFISDLPS